MATTETKTKTDKATDKPAKTEKISNAANSTIEETNTEFPPLDGCFIAHNSEYGAFDLKIADVPNDIYKNIITTAYAVMDQYALLSFDPSAKQISPVEIKEFKEKTGTRFLLSVGGEHGNFRFLNSPGNLTNFFNSLRDLYDSWYVDGINLDIRQFTPENSNYIIEAVKWFKEECADAMITLTGDATNVCPDVKEVGYKIGWNCLVPVIEEIEPLLGRVIIRAFDYTSKFRDYPELLKDTTSEAMLEKIFNNYKTPFKIGENNYPGVKQDKLILGVLSSPNAGISDYADPLDVRTAVTSLQKSKSIGGCMIWNINDDAENGYEFTKTVITGKKITQVYAVVFDKEGDFLIGKKREKGYFFANGNTGEIVKDGQPLNGGGKDALPGGKKKNGEAIDIAAAREFEEETGHKIGTDLTIRACFEGYAAAYYKIGEEAFGALKDQIVRSLAEAGEAVGKIEAGEITEYENIYSEFPACPADNELDSIDSWNINTDWERIEDLQKDTATNWYYEILKYLKDHLGK